MLEMLETALRKWSELKPEERLLREAPPRNPEVRPRNETKYPEGGLVLQVFSRDLPRSDSASDGWTGQAWNIDFAWFTKEEARSLLPAALEPGSRHDAPDPIVRRLARFHLVDNVRGQTPPFSAEHLQKAKLSVQVARREREMIHLKLEGVTRAVEKGRWPIEGLQSRSMEMERGYDAKLLGRAVYDLKAGRFVSFDMVVVGTRWGATQYNVRGRDLSPAPMGHALRLAPTSEGPDRVAPAYAGWDYFKP